MSEQPERQSPQLPPTELVEMDYVSHRWDTKAPGGAVPDDVLVPSFWAHNAVKMKPMDEIRVRADDGTWVGYYIVLDSSRTWARVRCLAFHNLTSADVAATQASSDEVANYIALHKVVHRGPLKWSVVRTSDKAVLHEGDEQKDASVAWLEAHARAHVGAPVVTPKAAVTA